MIVPAHAGQGRLRPPSWCLYFATLTAFSTRKNSTVGQFRTSVDRSTSAVHIHSENGTKALSLAMSMTHRK